jgi:hypothetical protein
MFPDSNRTQIGRIGWIYWIKRGFGVLAFYRFSVLAYVVMAFIA